MASITPRPRELIPFCVGYRITQDGALTSQTGIVNTGTVLTAVELPDPTTVHAVLEVINTWATDTVAGLASVISQIGRIRFVEVFSLAEAHGPEDSAFDAVQGIGNPTAFSAPCVECVLETNVRGHGNVGRFYVGAIAADEAGADGYWKDAFVTACATVIKNLADALNAAGFTLVVGKPTYGTAIAVVAVRGEKIISYQSRRGTGRD